MFLSNLLERLAELFPNQDYQSRLERYIRQHQPTSITEVEYWQKHFESQESKGFAQ
jgi:hypothetical protein